VIQHIFSFTSDVKDSKVEFTLPIGMNLTMMNNSALSVKQGQKSVPFSARIADQS